MWVRRIATAHTRPTRRAVGGYRTPEFCCPVSMSATPPPGSVESQEYLVGRSGRPRLPAIDDRLDCADDLPVDVDGHPAVHDLQQYSNRTSFVRPVDDADLIHEGASGDQCLPPRRQQ